MSDDRIDVFGGVDTHRDMHVAAVVASAGRVLGSESFSADERRLPALVAWIGVAGSPGYGSGWKLIRQLRRRPGSDLEPMLGSRWCEVSRPNRYQLRRQRGGKSDSVDAEGAARAAASGQATAVPKSGDGPVECLRMLLVARRSATKARTQAANQIHSVTVGAPEEVKRQLKGLNLRAQVRVCARWRPGECTDHCWVRETGSTPPGPPIPGPQRGDRRTRGRHPSSLR